MFDSKLVVKTILAFFCFHGQQIQMELKSANIRNGIAYLLPRNDKKIFSVKANNIKIILDNLGEDGVTVTDDPLDGSDKDTDKTEEKAPQVGPDSEHKSTKHGKKAGERPARDEDFSFLKKKFATGFYESEKTEIVSKYKSAGAKRDEYLLACVRAAAPRKVEYELKRIRREREEMLNT